MGYGLELVIIAIIKIVFVLAGGTVAIIIVNQIFRDFMYIAVENKYAADIFKRLLNVFVVILTGSFIINALTRIPSKAIPYIVAVDAFFDILQGLFNYFQWILVVLVGIFAFKFIGKKRIENKK